MANGNPLLELLLNNAVQQAVTASPMPMGPQSPLEVALANLASAQGVENQLPTPTAPAPVDRRGLGIAQAILQGAFEGFTGRPTGPTAIQRRQAVNRQQAARQDQFNLAQFEQQEQRRREGIRSAERQVDVARAEQEQARLEQREDAQRVADLERAMTDRQEDIMAGLGAVGLSRDAFDLSTPGGRADARGAILRKQAADEMSAKQDAESQALMRDALPLVEVEAAKRMIELTATIAERQGRGGVVRQQIQNEFELLLEEQKAILRGAGFSDQFIRRWVQSKQSRLESMLQGAQASGVQTDKATLQQNTQQLTGGNLFAIPGVLSGLASDPAAQQRVGTAIGQRTNELILDPLQDLLFRLNPPRFRGTLDEQ